MNLMGGPGRGWGGALPLAPRDYATGFHMLQYLNEEHFEVSLVKFCWEKWTIEYISRIILYGFVVTGIHSFCNLCSRRTNCGTNIVSYRLISIWLAHMWSTAVRLDCSHPWYRNYCQTGRYHLHISRRLSSMQLIPMKSLFHCWAKSTWIP